MKDAKHTYFNDLVFFFSEALNGIKRSGMMAVISVATISVSMIVFGLFLLVSVNLNNMANFMASRLEIRVYLKEDLTRPDQLSFQDRIARINHVRQVEYIGKDVAWKQFGEAYPTLALGDLLKTNPLPNSLKVKVTDDAHFERLVTYIRSFEEYVEDVTYGDIMAERIQVIYRVSKYSGYVLVGLLSFATLMIIMNTIRLTVIARQTEIEIMQLVGATNPFIRAPFMIEGFLIGAFGATISLLILKPLYTYLAVSFQEKIPYLPLVYDSAVLTQVYLIIGLSGIMLGIFGAFFAVTRSLKNLYYIK